MLKSGLKLLVPLQEHPASTIPQFCTCGGQCSNEQWAIIFESHSWEWRQDTIPWPGRRVPTDKARAEPVRGCAGCKLWETCVYSRRSSLSVCRVECSRKLKNWQMTEKTNPTIFHISFCISILPVKLRESKIRTTHCLLFLSLLGIKWVELFWLSRG